MTDRADRLRELATDLREHEAVADAWLAKSFTDRLLVLDLAEGTSVPDEIRALLNEHDCYGANEVYETGAADASFAGAVGDETRHQFVDVQTRGDHQSYVVE
ncbi:hypothetical protein [Halorientalis halophila]|uniref:hypothetical protein n=1 Tax=Halorientalis halophila TaxID=3108499 RepID=UPI00300B57A4